LIPTATQNKKHIHLLRSFRARMLVLQALKSLSVFFRTLLASMKNFTTYLSTAPVVALVWFTITAGLLIEINRFFPDPLVFSL